MPDTPTALAVPPDPLEDTDERVRRQVRMSPALWDGLVREVGEQNASSTIRRLIARHCTNARLRGEVARTPDPCPDRRFS